MATTNKYSELPSIFASKLENQQMVDFYFEFTDNTRFGVHSLILGTQSAIFKEMMKESSKTRKIHDISSGTFKKLVQVIYCAEISMESLEEGKELYKAGKKYEIEEAVNIARSVITKFCRDQKDALEVFDMAVINDDNSLKHHCMKCFSKAIKKYLGLEYGNQGNPFVFKVQKNPTEIQNLLETHLNMISEQATLDGLISNGLGFIKVLHDGLHKILRHIFLFEQFAQEFRFECCQNLRLPKPNSNDFKEMWNLTPTLTNSKSPKDKEFFQFKFDKDAGKNEVWLKVHRCVLESNSNILLSLFDDENDSAEIKNVQFHAFHSMIKKMYDIDVVFVSQEEVFDFYVACREFKYSDGIQFAQDYLMKSYKDDAIEKLYEFAKENRDVTLQNHCLRQVQMQEKVQFFVESIFKTPLMVSWAPSANMGIKNPFEIEEKISHAIKVVEDEPKLEQKLILAFNMFYILKEMMAKTLIQMHASDSLVYLIFENSESEQLQFDDWGFIWPNSEIDGELIFF